MAVWKLTLSLPNNENPISITAHFLGHSIERVNVHSLHVFPAAIHTIIAWFRFWRVIVTVSSLTGHAGTGSYVGRDPKRALSPYR